MADDHATDDLLEPSSRIGRLFDVRRHERGLLIAAISFAFLSVASAIVARAVGDALFLTAYPLASIPRFFVVSNIALIVGAMLYSSLVRVVRPVTLNVTGVAILAATMIAGRAVLPTEGASWSLYGLCVWLAVAPPLLNILCWNAIVDRLDSRQSRRLVPIIFAGCTVGAIGAGASIGPFIAALGLDNLLYVLAVLIALCIPLPVALASSPGGRSDAPSRSFIRDAPESLWILLKEGVTTVSRSRLLRTLAAVVFLASLVTTLVDFAFKAELQARFSRDEIGAFYGWFNAIGNTGNLFLQLVVVAWALDRWGPARIFRVLPATLLVGSLLLGLFPAFLTIVGLKLADGLLRFTFQTAANEVVLAPIAYLERNRAKIFIKGAMNPLGAILAGLLLIPLASGYVPRELLFGALVAALCIWLLLIRRVARAHAQQLYDSLRAKQAKRPVRGSGRFGVPRPVRPRGPARFRAHPDEAIITAAADGAPPRNERATALEDAAGYPLVGLRDAAPNVRRGALEFLATRERRCEALDVPDDLLEGLIWRELHLSFAIHRQRQELGDVGSVGGRQLISLLSDRLDDAVYRVFLGLGLRFDLEIAETAWHGLHAELQRTRAHALDLIEAALEATPFHRPVTVLLDEMTLAKRLERGARLDLDDDVFVDPLGVLLAEDDPQLNRLLLAMRDA